MRNVTGKVAPLEEVENATSIGSLIFLKKEISSYGLVENSPACLVKHLKNSDTVK